MAKAYTVTSGLLANACPEEPDALIALVRVCGGAPRVTGGSTRKLLYLSTAINELFMLTQPAHLQLNKGSELDPNNRDIMRAQIIREKLDKS